MDVKCTWNGTYCIVQDGSGWSILSSGSNTHGQLGHVGSAERVEFPDTVSTADTSVQIACGSEHVLALIRPVDEHPVAAIPTSQVWGWGWNEHGNLGVGNTGDAKFPVRIWPLGLDNPVDVSGIWAGCGTSWIYCKRREQ
jgi:protein ATS1